MLINGGAAFFVVKHSDNGIPFIIWKFLCMFENPSFVLEGNYRESERNYVSKND